MYKTKLIGREGEAEAARYLERKGYKIIGLNYSCRYGEIEVIAEKDGFAAIVEVKLRESADFAEAREFANGWAPVKDQATGLWGCSTVSGAWQVEPKFRAMGDIFYTSTDVFLPVQDNESGKWGVLDDAGDWRVMPKFDAII